MSAILDLTFAPFTFVLRQAYARPWLAFFVSGIAGLAALATHHELWMSLLISFAAYMLMWMDEMEHPAPEPVEAE